MTNIGRYQITGSLGEGAMGIVHRAYDPSLDREVAIKELALPAGTSGTAAQAAVDRFYTEARSAARLSHPNIVTIHEVGEDNGSPYIAMELLDGPTLDEVLAEAGALAPDQALGVMSQVAEALAASHAQGVIHRDIKPDNCFWLPDGRIKVADFGIARVATAARLTQAGTVMGTPGYMSPEQVRGHDADAATDVFSWGVMAYECLSGTPPFGDDDPTAVLYRIVHEDPPDLRALCPDASPVLLGVIARALAKDASQRYPDAGALLEDIEGEVIPTIPRAPRKRQRTSSMPPWSQTTPAPSSGPGKLIAIIVGILITAGGIGLVVSMLLRGEGDDIVTLPVGTSEEEGAATASPSPSESASPTPVSPVAGVTVDGVRVPARVLRVASAIYTAAESDDFSALNSLAAPDFTYSFGESGGPPGFYWEQLEEQGSNPLQVMTEILRRPPVYITGDISVYYQWHQKATYGYRLGISEDGAWLYFVAGD